MVPKGESYHWGSTAFTKHGQFARREQAFAWSYHEQIQVKTEFVIGGVDCPANSTFIILAIILAILVFLVILIMKHTLTQYTVTTMRSEIMSDPGQFHWKGNPLYILFCVFANERGDLARWPHTFSFLFRGKNRNKLGKCAREQQSMKPRLNRFPRS